MNLIVLFVTGLVSESFRISSRGPLDRVELGLKSFHQLLYLLLEMKFFEHSPPYRITQFINTDTDLIELMRNLTSPPKGWICLASIKFATRVLRNKLSLCIFQRLHETTRKELDVVSASFALLSVTIMSMPLIGCPSWLRCSEAGNFLYLYELVDPKMNFSSRRSSLRRSHLYCTFVVIVHFRFRQFNRRGSFLLTTESGSGYDRTLEWTAFFLLERFAWFLPRISSAGWSS